MRRLLATTAALFLTPVTAMAISLSEIASKPSQYELVYSDKNTEMYVDTSSIVSLRFTPPDYSMSTKGYLVIYNVQAILEETQFFKYDYNRSTRSIITNILKANPTASNHDIAKFYVEEKVANSGITWSATNRDVWRFDGSYVEHLDPLFDQKIGYLSGTYKAAFRIFFEYYNDVF